jgi:hypothetical protein
MKPYTAVPKLKRVEPVRDERADYHALSELDQACVNFILENQDEFHALNLSDQLKTYLRRHHRIGFDRKKDHV